MTNATSEDSSEWEMSGWDGSEMVVEIQETARNDTEPTGPPEVVVVRAEEALIVILVLVLWVAAIALFFNRWGKIRMLEPYQPKFQQQHRASCPLVDVQLNPSQRASFSKFNVNFDQGHRLSISPGALAGRPRQNSVFVGSASSVAMLHSNPPRKTRSAVDIHHLVLTECGPPVSTGAIPKHPPTGARRESFAVATHV